MYKTLQDLQKEYRNRQGITADAVAKDELMCRMSIVRTANDDIRDHYLQIARERGSKGGQNG